MNEWGAGHAAWAAAQRSGQAAAWRRCRSGAAAGSSCSAQGPKGTAEQLPGPCLGPSRRDAAAVQQAGMRSWEQLGCAAGQCGWRLLGDQAAGHGQLCRLALGHLEPAANAPAAPLVQGCAHHQGSVGWGAAWTWRRSDGMAADSWVGCSLAARAGLPRSRCVLGCMKCSSPPEQRRVVGELLPVRQLEVPPLLCAEGGCLGVGSCSVAGSRGLHAQQHAGSGPAGLRRRAGAVLMLVLMRCGRRAGAVLGGCAATRRHLGTCIAVV